MTIAWVAYASVSGVCIGGIALAIERVLSIWSVQRRFVWIVALLTAAVLPLSRLDHATAARGSTSVPCPRNRRTRSARLNTPSRTIDAVSQGSGGWFAGFASPWKSTATHG